MFLGVKRCGPEGAYLLARIVRWLIDYVVELVTPLVLEIGRHHGVEVEGQPVDEMGEEGIVGSDSRHRSDVIRKEGGERRDSRQ